MSGIGLAIKYHRLIFLNILIRLGADPSIAQRTSTQVYALSVRLLESNINIYTENQREISPGTNRFMPLQEKENFEGINIRDNATEVDVPNTRDQFSNFNTGVYNSPIRGSYSAKRFKKKSLITAQKMQNSQKKIPIPPQRRYSLSKNSPKNIKSDSKQSPTFRPNYVSSATSRKSKLSLKPPKKEKKKANKNIIGKTKEGKPVLSHFAMSNIAIDFIDDKPKNYQRKRISPEDEDKTREWLRRINFHNYLNSDQLDLMEDPVRNGIMLCEVLCFLETIQLFDLCYKPKTMKEWRDNVDKAISIWHQVDRIRENMPPSLLANRELILKGDHPTFWGILNWLRKLYPDVWPRENMAYLKDTLPYTPKELIALEASLLRWIHGWGVLRGYKTPPSSILEIQEELKNGVIICKLVQFIFNLNIPWVFKDPRTESTKISNLRKATEILKKEKSMSQKYTWSEKEIVKGNKEHILGLLEDMHLLFDGHPPRQWGQNYFDNGPYIGATKVFDQINRKLFYYQKESKDDTFELEEDTDDEKENRSKNKIKDFIGKARQKYSNQPKVSQIKPKKKKEDEESNQNLRLNTSQEIEKGLNTDRPNKKFEEIPSIINNQMGDDLWSPISKVKPRNDKIISGSISQTKAKQGTEVYKTYTSTEMPMSAFRSSQETQDAFTSNQKINSKIESGIMSPESHTFLPHKRITEESMDYSEKSRSEELEQLEDSVREAHQNYANQKNIYKEFRKNPFSIGHKREDIGPFKEYMKRHKNRVEDDVKELERMFDEETAFLDKDSSPQDIKQLLNKYRDMGVKISDHFSNEAKESNSKDKSVLKDIFAFVEGQKMANKTKDQHKMPASSARAQWSKKIN
jgi:hypothetical protein